jgi:hypothetical protein
MRWAREALHKARGLAVPTCVAGAFLALAGSAAAGGAAQTFTDAQGDSVAADIVRIDLSVSAGILDVRIEVPNRSSAPVDEEIDLYMDGDHDVSTGSLGADYAIGVSGRFSPQVNFFRFNGTQFEPYSVQSFSGSYSNGVLHARVALVDFGAPAILDFFAYAWAISSSSVIIADYAPNAGKFSFDTRGTTGFDTDSDGIPDDQDACLKVAGGQYDTNDNGCPGPFPKLQKPILSFRGGRATGGLRLTSATLTDVPAGAKVVIKHGNRTQTSTKQGSGPLKVRILVGRLLATNSVIRITITKPGTIGFAGKYRVKSDGIARFSAQCVPPGGGSARACGGIDDGS